ncbi:MAG TPA: hypothetical protein VLJ39_04120, partial [Tepidisphaeraceae bacterium]|nr:hypothetical protein [Tepidisphaeraceae bacterium]
MTRAGVLKTVRRKAGQLAVATVAAGCGCLIGCAPEAQQPAAAAVRPQSADAPAVVHFGDDAASRNSQDPGLLNVFGEMKEIKAGPVKPATDSNFQQHTFIDSGYDADVAVDPTGKLIVFASTRDSEHSNIFIQRTDGTAVTQLTSEAADDAYPVFSPDGKQIAFCSTRAGNWQIFTMDANGKNVTQVTTGPTQAVHPSWSPDGTRVVYSSLGFRSQQWELWTYNLQTNEKRMIGFGLFPSWSPRKDIDRIAFQRPRQKGSRWFSLWTIDLLNGEASLPTEIVVSSNAAIVSPTWNAEGTRVAFATVMRPNSELPRGAKGRTDVWVVNADGTERQRLTDGVGTNLMPFWSG